MFVHSSKRTRAPKRKPRVEIVDEDTCPCIIQSGVRKGQMCGKVLKEGTLACGLHQKSCQSMAVVVPIKETKKIHAEEVKIQVQGDTCPCLIQTGARRGQACGVRLQAGMLRCVRHSKTKCVMPAATIPEVEEAPVIKIQSPRINAAPIKSPSLDNWADVELQLNDLETYLKQNLRDTRETVDFRAIDDLLREALL